LGALQAVVRDDSAGSTDARCAEMRAELGDLRAQITKAIAHPLDFSHKVAVNVIFNARSLLGDLVSLDEHLLRRGYFDVGAAFGRFLHTLFHDTHDTRTEDTEVTFPLTEGFFDGLGYGFIGSRNLGCMFAEREPLQNLREHFLAALRDLKRGKFADFVFNDVKALVNDLQALQRKSGNIAHGTCAKVARDLHELEQLFLKAALGSASQKQEAFERIVGNVIRNRVKIEADANDAIHAKDPFYLPEGFTKGKALGDLLYLVLLGEKKAADADSESEGETESAGEKMEAILAELLVV